MKKASFPDTTGKWASIALEFLMLFAFWLILSGRFQAKYIILGAVSAALVTCLSHQHFYAVLRMGEFRTISIGHIIGQLWRFLLYVPWLLLEIIKANVQVAYYVLHPNMPIDPGLLTFRSGMKKYMSQTTLANSITLTPGTITAELENNVYSVHTLKRSLAGLLESGEMQGRVSRIFREEPESNPSTKWVSSFEDTTK